MRIVHIETKVQLDADARTTYVQPTMIWKGHDIIVVFIKVHVRNAKIREVKFRKTLLYCRKYDPPIAQRANRKKRG